MVGSDKRIGYTILLKEGWGVLVSNGANGLVLYCGGIYAGI